MQHIDFFSEIKIIGIIIEQLIEVFTERKSYTRLIIVKSFLKVA